MGKMKQGKTEKSYDGRSNWKGKHWEQQNRTEYRWWGKQEEAKHTRGKRSSKNRKDQQNEEQTPIQKLQAQVDDLQEKMQKIQQTKLEKEGNQDTQHRERERISDKQWTETEDASKTTSIHRETERQNEGSSTDNKDNRTEASERERGRSATGQQTQREQMQQFRPSKNPDGKDCGSHGVPAETQKRCTPSSGRTNGPEGEEQKEKPQTQEPNKDTWASSQQSGFWTESTLAKGATDSLQQIPLQLKWVKSYFSDEEKDFFIAAATEGKVSQTYYTNPDAETCYRCPICARALNPSGLSKHTSRHFLRMRNTPNRECIVTLHEEPRKQIRFRTGENVARRSGADPPPSPQILDQIQDREDQAKKQQKTGAKKHTIGVPRSKQKQKGRPVKKKRRMSWQQAEQREPSNYGHPDSPKRKR